MKYNEERSIQILSIIAHGLRDSSWWVGVAVCGGLVFEGYSGAAVRDRSASISLADRF